MGQSTTDFFVLLLLLCLFGCFLECLLFFLNYKQISVQGFCNFWCRIFFWHLAVIRSMSFMHSSFSECLFLKHRKPLTRGGLPSLGTGVF